MIKLNKIFVFLKENNILLEIKTRLLSILEQHKDRIKEKLEPKIIDYIDNGSEFAKEYIINFVVDEIELPFPINLFKKKIKKTVEKNIDKLVVFLKTQIDKY
jgi:hypothetical protein